MAFSQCEYCSSICNMAGQKLCPQCSKELDAIFKKIRKYMYMTSERVTAANIVEDLDVPEKAVEYLIRDNRLILNRGDKTIGKCKICGLTTEGDILCRNCRKKFSEGMQKYREEQEREETRPVPVQPIRSSAIRLGSVQPLKKPK